MTWPACTVPRGGRDLVALSLGADAEDRRLAMHLRARGKREAQHLGMEFRRV
jgi:hypothetical protein